MRHLLLSCVIILSSVITAFSQNAPHRELGFRFDGIDLDGYNDFSLVYKKQKANGKYARWRAGYGELSGRLTEDFNNFGFGFGIHYGIERRKPLTDKFAFAHGPELGVGFSIITQNLHSPSTRTSLRLGYVLGLQYDFAKAFFLNAETIPNANLGLDINGDNAFWGFGVRFISNAALTLGWRF